MICSCLCATQEETMQSYRSTAASQVSFDLELTRGMALPGVSFTATFRYKSDLAVASCCGSLMLA